MLKVKIGEKEFEYLTSLETEEYYNGSSRRTLTVNCPSDAIGLDELNALLTLSLIHISEISFVKYAYQNYNSIMSHEAQRTATIASIQKAKKVAMKDIEFYMNDLDSAAKTKDNSELISTVNKAFQIKESLELSMQLYVFSNLLELYYSQNADSSYIKYVEADVSSYIDKCEKRMLSSFSVLDAFVRDYKGNLLKKIDTSEIEKEVGGLLDRLNNGEEIPMRQTLHAALSAQTRKAEYYMAEDGNIYLKTA